MSTRVSVLLLALACLELVGFAVGGLLVSQADARRRRRAARIAAALAPFRAEAPLELPVFRPPPRERSLATLAAGLFGFDPAHADQYPLRWWLVLPLALVIARLLAQMASGVLGSWVGLPALPLLWVLFCRAYFGWATRRRKELLIRQFPDALGMIVRSVRVGIPVLTAVGVVAREAPAPTAPEFARLADDLSLGVPLHAAVAALAERGNLAEYRFFATTIALQAQTGGGLSETLQNLAELIRKRLALRERAAALSSEARTSAMVLVALPVVMGLGLWALNPDYMSALFTTGTGRKLLGFAVLSLGIGLVTMRTIIQRSLS
jgi:tight adherence protein B